MTSAHPIPPLPCLSDLEIADLIAGRLQGEDRARALRHLAECESCYEIYAEAQALLAVDADEQDEPGNDSEVGLPEPLPFRSPAKKLPWFLAIAAGLMAGIGLALLMPSWKARPPAEAARWPALGELPRAAVVSGPLPPSPGDQVRGTDKISSGTVADFLLGVDWAHLEEAWQQRDAAAVAATARNIQASLKTHFDSPPELSGSLRRELVRMLEEIQSAPPEVPFLPPALTLQLSREKRVWGYEFDLGRFAEAGRLAAMAGRRDFFAPGSAASLYLAVMLKWDEQRAEGSEPLAAMAREGVRAIAASWPAEPIPPGEPLTGVAEAFTSLILAYDTGAPL